MSGGEAFRAAIFDMDGLLIDSEPLWRIAEMEEFRAVGIELDEAACESTMGQRTDEVVATWYRRSPWTGPSCADVAARITERVIELIAARGRAMPGVHSALRVVRQGGLLAALASSSPPEIIRTALARIELEQYFDVVCSAVEERHGKPHPDVFLRAAQRLQVAPARCVVFEDSVAGVEAAVRAGMAVVAVPDPNRAEDSGFDIAAGRLRSLEELTTSWLAELAVRSRTPGS